MIPTAAEFGGIFYTRDATVTMIVDVTGAIHPQARLACSLNGIPLQGGGEGIPLPTSCPSDAHAFPATLHLKLYRPESSLAIDVAVPRNVSSLPSSTSFTFSIPIVLDTAAPDVHVLAPMRQRGTTATAAMRLILTRLPSVGDASRVASPEKLWCSLDNAAFSLCELERLTEATASAETNGHFQATVTVEGLTHGNHTLEVMAIDMAGNQQSVTREMFFMNVQALLVGFTGYPRQRLAAGDKATFTLLSRNAVALTCMLNERPHMCTPTPDENGNVMVMLDNIMVGENTFAVEARDEAGNQATTEYRWNVVGGGGQQIIANPIAFTDGGISSSLDWNVQLAGPIVGARCLLVSVKFAGGTTCCNRAFPESLCRDVCLGDGIMDGCADDHVGAFESCMEAEVAAAGAKLQAAVVTDARNGASACPASSFAVTSLGPVTVGHLHLLTVQPAAIATADGTPADGTTIAHWAWAVVPLRTEEAARLAASQRPSTCPGPSGDLVAFAVVGWVAVALLAAVAYRLRARLRVGLMARRLLREEYERHRQV